MSVGEDSDISFTRVAAIDDALDAPSNVLDGFTFEHTIAP